MLTRRTVVAGFAESLEPAAREAAIKRGRAMLLERLADHFETLGDALPSEGPPVEVGFAFEPKSSRTSHSG